MRANLLLILLLLSANAAHAEPWQPWEKQPRQSRMRMAGAKIYTEGVWPSSRWTYGKDPTIYDAAARREKYRVEALERAEPLGLGYAKFMAEGYLEFYQTQISPMDGPKCPHYPTCSEYSRRAVGLYGALFGILMTADRLTREGYRDMIKNYRLVWKYGRPRYYDLPEHNYIWEDPDLVRHSFERLQ